MTVVPTASACDAGRVTSPRGLPLLPAACSLDADSGPERVARWARLLDRSTVHRLREPGEVRIGFRPDDQARRELGDLVAAEQSCCAFVGWSIEDTDGRLELVVTGRAEDLDTLQLI